MPKKAVALDEPESARVHAIYSFLLGSLDLSPDHLRSLNTRGFSPQEIRAAEYKTFPTSRKNLVERIARKFKNDLSGVPGFWRNEKGEWELAGKTGVAIPVRDLEGKICAIKLRVDKPSSPSSKYILLSSNPRADKKTGVVQYPSGTSAHIRVHWPRGRPKKIKVLRITEGELKADIATSLSDTYTVSLPGVTMWRMALDIAREFKPAKILIAFDSDKTKSVPSDESTSDAYRGGSSSSNLQATPEQPPEEDYVVGKSLAALYLALRDAGFKASIEHWPAEAGKGIDDVLVNGSSDEIKELTDDEAAMFAKELLQADLPDDWIYVVGVKRFYHLKTLVELDKEQFGDRFSHENKGNPATAALKNAAFTKVDFPIYLPKQTIFFERDSRKYFNTWRPGFLNPVAGNCDLFVEHCAYLVPEEKERNVFLDWLAFLVQFPGEKIMWAILLQGQQGTGKSFFGSVMRELLGPHNVSVPTNEMIHEVFTGWQKACQLVIIEELMARGRLELMNKLKPMITQEVTMVREMHKPAYEQPNVFNFLMFTNHEDAVILDRTDRRYCVLFSPAEPKGPEYYKSLWKWLRENSAHVLDFLLNRDLSGFESKGHAPMTSGKQQIIDASLPPLQVWISEGIENGAWPFMGDLVSVNHLVECLPRHLQASSLQSVSKTLKGIGSKQLGQIQLKSGAQVRVWSVRRHEIWAGAEVKTLAGEYERWGMSSQPGGNPMLESKPM